MELYYNCSKHSRSTIKKSDLKPEYLLPTTKCGCCGCERFTVLIPLYDSPSVNYIRCCGCGAVTFDKIYANEGLDEIYQSDSYYEECVEAGNSNITFFGAERFAKRLFKYMSKLKTGNDDMSILDFGGGSGEISYKFAKMLLKKQIYKKIEIVVSDYNEILYDENDDRISVSRIFPLDAVGDRKFDIVIASAVIEHLPAPGEFVHILFSSVKSGGRIYFRTPYIFPLFRTLKRFNIEYYTSYPSHLWDFSKEWLEKADEHVNYPPGQVKLLHSCPSITEKSLRNNFFGALAAIIMKSIYYICHKWRYVGGWEVVFEKV